MSKPSILIEPSKGWASLDLTELWQYRELIVFLAWRNIMALYKQAFFGIAWALAKPISQALIYTLVFGKVAKLSSSGQPYILFTFCGIVAWGFFSTSLSSSTNSIVGNANLITKVYFPRLAIPLSSLGTGCVDFVISFVILMIIMLFYGILPGWEILLFPVFLALGFALTLGLGLVFSAISVKYRDLSHALPFLVQLWFWVTPVAYGIENIPPKFAWIFYLNPMTWIIQGFRWSLLGVGEMNLQNIVVTALFSFAVLLSGLVYFRRMEDEFADVI